MYILTDKEQHLKDTLLDIVFIISNIKLNWLIKDKFKNNCLLKLKFGIKIMIGHM